MSPLAAISWFYAVNLRLRFFVGSQLQSGLNLIFQKPYPQITQITQMPEKSLNAVTLRLISLSVTSV